VALFCIYQIDCAVEVIICKILLLHAFLTFSAAVYWIAGNWLSLYLA